MTNERAWAQLEARLRVVEEGLKTVGHEVQRLRDWRHEFPQQLITPIQDQLLDLQATLHGAIKELANKPPDSRLSMRDFWIAAGALSAGFTAAVWLFTSFANRMPPHP